jgi:tetratricopeptide (TPR) repeat protein
MLASREGHAEVAQILLDAGAGGSPAAAAFTRGWNLATQGAISDALAAYAEGDSLESTLAIAPAAWEALCWYRALAGHAAEVMAACDRAVALRPAPRDRDEDARLARGIARALLGDYAGAVTDLEAVVDPSLDAEDGYRVPEWIAALREGRSPFTPARLADLRQP